MKRIETEIISAVVLLTATLPWITACSVTESGTMSCPPGLVRAAQQSICVHGSCGNGLLDAREACDDGNRIDGDGCSSDCRSRETCGNAIVDHSIGEVCDDGNLQSNDQCCGDCRSCPELAVRPFVGESDLGIEQALSAALPCLSGPAAAISFVRAMAASLVSTVLAPARSSPAPFLTMTAAPASVLPTSPVTDSITQDIDVTPTWLAAALEQARSAAKDAEARLKSEKRKGRRVKKAQAHLAEELQRALQTVAQLEQINAELHRYVAAECQQVKTNGRSNKLE